MGTPFGLTVEAAVSRVRAREGEIHAFVSTRLEAALAEAALQRAERRTGPLVGVPYGLKDEWETTCLPTTGGSWRYRDRRSTADCSVHEALREAGGVLVGKTNLSDLGVAPEASSYVGGETRNPHGLDRTAGGSSRGAAAAVADGMVAFDWGTDIGGSIRLPAAFCGVYGLRLSASTWPLTGLFPTVPQPLVPMCGQGPLARSTEQIRAVLDVVAPRVRTGTAAFAIKGAVVVEPEVAGDWPSFAEDVGGLLARQVGRLAGEAGLPGTLAMRNAYHAMWCAHFADLLTVDPGLGLWSGLRAVVASLVLGDRAVHPRTAEILLAVTIGRLTLYRDRAAAQRRAQAVIDGFRRLWDRGLVVVLPVCVRPSPKVGTSNRFVDLLDCTVPGNLADATGLAVPFGTFPNGLPRAYQLLGPPGSELALLDLADQLGAVSLRQSAVSSGRTQADG